MNNTFTQWLQRCVITAATATVAISCTSPCQALPDYNAIGNKFSVLIQNGHFDRKGFNSELYKDFLKNYLKEVDPNHLYLTQKDVDYLYDRYVSTFGDYLLAKDSVILAEQLYTYYSERALTRIAQAEELIKSYDDQAPTFESNREIPRSRRKLDWAKDDAELTLIWKNQIDDMVLSETLRRENIAKRAKESGKPAPTIKDLPINEKILARLKRLRNTIQEADREDMVSKLLTSVAGVYDPHSSYMGAREQKRFLDMMKLSLIGIGAQLQADDDGSTKITGLVTGGPADKSGLLKLGDHVVAVDRNTTGEWTDILFMSIEKVIDYIRGEEGKTVSLRVQRPSSGEEIIIKIKRAKVPMSDELAQGKVIITKDKDMQGNEREYRLGIITIPSFYVDLQKGSSHCASDVKAILQRMTANNVKGIVFDLRGNGGGSLEEVRKIVGFFSGAGPTVQVKNARGHIQRLTVSGKPIFDGQLVVLCNKLSASASEIFAGAMADYGRAIIVGDTTTFGKGTVQVPRDIGDFMPIFSSREGSGMLKITTQKFYRIGGASTQLKGVESDIVLPSVTAGFDIGEAQLDYAMPYDEIAPAPGFVKASDIARVLPMLKKRSEDRVAKDMDLQYMNESIQRFREHREKNIVSLNKQVRIAETDKLLQRKKEMDAERKIRYAEMSKSDAANKAIYNITMENVDKPELVLASEEKKTEYMAREKDPDQEFEESPDAPSDLDAELRESLQILRDMIDTI